MHPGDFYHLLVGKYRNDEHYRTK